MLDFIMDLWAAVHFRRLIMRDLAIIVVEALIIVGLIHMLLRPAHGRFGGLNTHRDAIHAHAVAPGPLLTPVALTPVAPIDNTTGSAWTLGGAR